MKNVSGLNSFPFFKYHITWNKLSNSLGISTQPVNKKSMIPAIFSWDSTGNAVHMIMGLVRSRTSALGITICAQWKVLEAPCSTAASCYSQWCHSGRWLCHGLWFHSLSWTVAATVHVALTVLGARVCIFGAPPLLAVGPPALTWLRIHLLPIESAIAHCKIMLKLLSQTISYQQQDKQEIHTMPQLI